MPQAPRQACSPRKRFLPVSKTPLNALQFTGAPKGSVLIGFGDLNRDLLVRVHSDQQKNRTNGGHITGEFTLICAGTGQYAEYLRAFEGQSFKAASDLLQEVRDRGGKKCTYVLNSECLTLTSDTASEIQIPEEIPDADDLYEGAVQRIKVNVYERNVEAKRRCVGHYGSRCQCCDLKLSEVYDELGEGLIHVHHLVPISSVGKRYKIDPIRDLVPICPNCHAIIHRQNPPLTIDDVKRRILENNCRREK